jgi:hypothetical protein
MKKTNAKDIIKDTIVAELKIKPDGNIVLSFDDTIINKQQLMVFFSEMVTNYLTEIDENKN